MENFRQAEYRATEGFLSSKYGFYKSSSEVIWRGGKGSSKEKERTGNNYCLDYLRTLFFLHRKMETIYCLEKYIKNVHHLMLNVL